MMAEKLGDKIRAAEKCRNALLLRPPRLYFACIVTDREIFAGWHRH
jgi:hypothetical protein